MYSDLVYTFIFVLSFLLPIFLLSCVRLFCLSAWVCITADDSAPCLVLHSVQVHESKQVHNNDGIRLPADDHIVDFFHLFCISFKVAGTLSPTQLLAMTLSSGNTYIRMLELAAPAHSRPLFTAEFTASKQRVRAKTMAYLSLILLSLGGQRVV